MVPRFAATDRDPTEYVGKDGKDPALRNPYKANTDDFRPFDHADWPVEDADLIGLTGWDFSARRTRHITIDLDAEQGHTGKKCLTQDQLDSLEKHFQKVPCLEVRRSKGGLGLHVVLYADPADQIRSSNHTAHAQRGRSALKWLGEKLGFDLAPYVDVVGGNAWIYAKKTGPDGFKLLKESQGYAPAEAWAIAERTKAERTKAEPTKTATNDPVLTDVQNRILDGLRDRKALNSWDGEKAVTHTSDLRAVAQGLGIEFKTDATGKDRPGGPPNCWMKADENGDGFVVFRYGNHPEPTWRVSPKGTYYAVLGTPKPKDKPTFELINATVAASADYSIEWLVDEVLVKDQPCMWGGRSKSMKTTLLCDLALAVASGGRFLNRYHSRPANVLMMSGESGMATLVETCKRISSAYGYDFATMRNLNFCTRLPRLDNPLHREALSPILPRDGLLIIDPAYLSLPSKDAGNVFSQGEMLARIAELCQSSRTTLILCHHFKKNTGRDAYDVPELDDFSWSGFAEFARQYVLIGRREKYAQNGQHKLWAMIGGSVGHSHQLAIDIDEGVYMPGSPRKWELAVLTPREMRDMEQRAKEHEEKAKILLVLGECDNGETPSEIARQAHVGKTGIDKLLAEMADEGSIVACQVPKTKQTYPGFKLAC
ncbi:MAG: AAA family ATPase [Pirellulales bacterium]